jgi:hypothetical protein
MVRLIRLRSSFGPRTDSQSHGLRPTISMTRRSRHLRNDSTMTYCRSDIRRARPGSDGPRCMRESASSPRPARRTPTHPQVPANPQASRCAVSCPRSTIDVGKGPATNFRHTQAWRRTSSNCPLSVFIGNSVFPPSLLPLHWQAVVALV